MGEHEFELEFDSGQLYFIEPDETEDTSLECPTEDNITVSATSLINAEMAFDCFVKITKEALLRISGLYDEVIGHCPDRRVAHLAMHGKKARIRKKNFNRAIKILEDLDG